MFACLWVMLAGCLHEKYKGADCFREVAFEMKEVPYVFVDDEAVAYQPYYTFVEQLDLYVFADEQLHRNFIYDFAYCREHPVISETLDLNVREALFVTNLYDPQKLNWYFENDTLQAVFSILDYEEPPVLLAAIADIRHQSVVPVELRMLISRLEIKLVNPPAWMTGLNVMVRNVAGTVSTDYKLGDTTHINKQMFFENKGPGTYSFGVNTFPTYNGKAAVLSILPIGTEATAPILVEDSELHFLPGTVTRLNIVYDPKGDITLSIEIDGKWEIVDGGNIII